MTKTLKVQNEARNKNKSQDGKNCVQENSSHKQMRIGVK